MKTLSRLRPACMHPEWLLAPAKSPVRHPGEILLEEYLDPYAMSQNELARVMGVSARRVNEIVLGKRRVTGATALLLQAALGTNARYWMIMQADYDLDQARMPRERRRRRTDPIESRQGQDPFRWEREDMRESVAAFPTTERGVGEDPNEL